MLYSWVGNMLFVFRRFKGAIWQRLSPDQRLMVLQALEKKMAKKQRRPWINVVVYPDSEWKSLGMFYAQNDEQVLYVNEKLLLNHDLRFFALETIVHEGRHAYQYYVINNKKLHFYNFKERAWKNNLRGYIHSGDDATDYNIQAVERDAQAYTIKFLKSVAYKYRGERAFQYTLQANQQRHEQSEYDAVKRYGWFYKMKIDKKIGKNKR